MFCPKCGTQNPDNGVYCRNCGTDLGNVSAALAGVPVNVPPRDKRARRELKQQQQKLRSPGEFLAHGVRSTIVGLGFLIAACVLLLTNAANGHTWWWALLFPGFASLGKGVSDLIAYQVNKKNVQSYQQPAFGPQGSNPAAIPPAGSSLPPTQTQYVSPDYTPESRYKTGDLVPPSVTDNTTRHLEINPEGQTMSLPKK